MSSTIKRITTPEELSKIFSVLPSEYIQWLTEGITNPKLHVWVESEADEIAEIAYVVALDSVAPPISDYFTVLFDYGKTDVLLTVLLEEAAGCGAKQLVMAVPEITSDMEKEGFKQVSVNIAKRI